MKKILIFSIIVLVAVIAGVWFLSARESKMVQEKYPADNKEVRKTEEKPTAQEIPEWPIEPKALQFLEKNCKPESKIKNIWNCEKLYEYTDGPIKFAEDCRALGYKFHCSGSCGTGKCYLFKSAGTECKDTSECESGWCQSSDMQCTQDCTGRCSGEFPPDQCSSAEIFEFRAIEKGTIVRKKAGGALCD